MSGKYIPRFFPAKHVQHGRKPQDENKVPFKCSRDAMVLKDRVTTSRDDTKGAFCVPELLTVLACLNKHEFEERFCSDEINKFNNCAKVHFIKLKQRKARRHEGGYTPGEKLDHVGISAFLKKFPNI